GMHGGHSASLIIPFSNVQRRCPAAGDGEAALVPHDDLAGLGKMPSACSPRPRRPDNKRFLAPAAPRPGVRPACCPDQPVNVDGVLSPIDPPVFLRALSRPARIALILLEARWRAGRER